MIGTSIVTQHSLLVHALGEFGKHSELSSGVEVQNLLSVLQKPSDCSTQALHDWSLGVCAIVYSPMLMAKNLQDWMQSDYRITTQIPP